jgi:predicted nucleic acid-binding protein
MHPWVCGELALGTLKNRETFLALLASLPMSEIVPNDEVMSLVERRQLAGRGIGWVDTHLLAACLARPCRLWTNDRRLAALAVELGIGFTTPLQTA